MYMASMVFAQVAIKNVTLKIPVYPNISYSFVVFRARDGGDNRALWKGQGIGFQPHLFSILALTFTSFATLD